MAKPAVSGIESDIPGLALVRVNATSAEGRRVAAHLGAYGVPNLVVVDKDGTVVHRQVGRIDRGEAVAALHLQGF